MEENETSFEEWFDSFCEFARITFNYNGPIDRDTFQSEFDEGKDAREAAEEFVKEMNS